MAQKKYPIESIVESIHKAIDNEIDKGNLDSKNLTVKEIRHILPKALDLFQGSLCIDCGMETIPEEYYMLHDEVWGEANPKKEGMLCIGCVERRLGRSLNKDDFTSALINQINEKESTRLKTRKML